MFTFIHQLVSKFKIHINMNKFPFSTSFGIATVLIVLLLLVTHCRKEVGTAIDQLDGYQVEYSKKEKKGDFWEYTCSTPNVFKGRNRVKGIVLHHTATASTGTALKMMAGPEPTGKVSCHVVIAPDGTRYVLAPPTARTWHAGKSRWKGQDWCNAFTVGIEFQGNTCAAPLTDAQIQSAIDYCLPIMKKYKLKESDIITHEMIRTEYIKAHPEEGVPNKPDITQKEHARFLKALHDRRSS